MVRGRECSIRRALVDEQHGFGEGRCCESRCAESGRHCYRWRSCHSDPDEIDSFDSDRSRVNQRSDRVWVVESLARPGRNVTGFSLIEFSIFGKMLETLKRLDPGISRVAMMYNPDNPVGAAYLRAFEMVAGPLAVQPINLPIHDLADIERAIASLAEQPNGGVLFPPDVTIFSLRAQVSALLARYRVPAISIYSALTAAGGLVSYGPDRTAMFRQSASYVDRILRGEKPGDLPFQQPTTYRLVINLKAAKALGLTVPDTLLVAADEVIE